jgi:hypothetical protein
MSESGSTPDGTDSGGSVSKLLITTVIAIVLGAGEEILDPFGLDSSVDQLSANIFNAITAPFYGAQSNLTLDGVAYPSRFGQSNIAVILIDDDYLEAAGKTWPLDTRQYRRMLRKLVDADAAAVFVDIYFRQDSERRSERIAELYRQSSCLSAASACLSAEVSTSCAAEAEPAACEANDPNGGTAIYFAGTLQDPLPSAAGSVPPASALAEMLSGENIYNLSETAANGQRYDTAGWALYKAWCHRDERCDETALAEFPTSPMYLHWGYAPNRAMTGIPDFGADKCRPQAAGMAGRYLHSVQIFGWNMVRGFNDSRIAPCPYHTQVKLPLFNNLSADELRQLFAGKVVLIGAALRNFPDYHWSPVHDYIPGVFWHAMAADNLMEFGSHYRKDPQEFGSNNFEAIGVTLILLLHALIARRIQRKENRYAGMKLTEAERQNYEMAGFKLDLLHGLFTISVIAATVLFFTGLKNWSPANWIGFAMLMLLIDYQPVSSLGRFCWRIYPTARLTERMFSFWLYKLLAGFTVLLALLPAFALFIIPHALLLGRNIDDTIGSTIFLIAYAVIGGGSMLVIYRETA